MSSTRQLAAILFTDIVGYAALMQENEEGALAVVRQYAAVLKETVEQCQGNIVNDYGDGNLCTFTSATEAVRCAIDLQRKLQSGPRVPLRIGLHIGEIFFEDGKVFGDGVNVASRIQSLGVANSILFSGEIQNKLKNQQEFKISSLGFFHFKNVTEPMEVFALANEGLLVPERGSMEGKLKPKESHVRKWLVGVAVVLIVLISVFIYRYLLTQPKRGDIRKSIAVLAFADLSPNKDQAWFSDGISEEIINSLTNLKELRVTARTSSFYFKDKDLPLAEIAKKLGVEFIVEGSVRKENDQLRVTIQLINAVDESHLFSQTYDRPATGLLSVQSDIAQIIAGQLLGHLTEENQLKIELYKPSSLEGYEYYLRASEAFQKLSRSPGEPESYDAAAALMLKAISLDPNYIPAYWRLLSSYNWQSGSLDGARYWELRDSIAQVVYKLC